MQNLLKASYQLVIFVHKETYETKYIGLTIIYSLTAITTFVPYQCYFMKKFTFDHPITYITLALVVVTLPL